jgi:cytochrome c oxidase subunit 2
MIMLALQAGRGMQSSLSPNGFNARQIAGLWNVFLITTAVIFVLVMIALVLALLRRGSIAVTDHGSFRTGTVVSVATGISAVTLFALLIASILTGRTIADVPHAQRQVLLTGRQWWWQVEYDDADVSRRVTSANEINVPVGVPVNVRLHSPDVIHSFWVPSLSGKRDLIPGSDGSITILAEKAGVYRGQCAEYCGVQHAKMAFFVNALPPADYQRWLEAQRQPGRAPSTSEEKSGREVFLRSPCPLCHNVQGTDASGRTGPDLTHFGSRRSIGAGALPNTRDALASWILDPQHVKPGSQMPPMLLARSELDPLVTYLESLR